MEFLGIGPSELFFVVVLALIILGPKDMQKAGKTIGRWMRTIVTSDGWRIFQQTSRELRSLPNRLMREANDELNQINRGTKEAVGGTSDSGTDPGLLPRSQPFDASSKFPDNQIAPPAPAPEREEDDPPRNA